MTKGHEHHRWPPSGGLPHLIFFASSNGVYKVIRRVGRRVLIDEVAFFRWVEENTISARWWPSGHPATTGNVTLATHPLRARLQAVYWRALLRFIDQRQAL